MKSFCITGLALCCFTLSCICATATEAPSDLPQIALTLGVQGGEDEQEMFSDVFVPVYLTQSGLWFVNPRFSADDDSEEELNLGLGYRHLFPEKNIILGGNVYYDSRWTKRDTHFNQMGVGLEMLTEWIDARANYYLPEDKEELVDSFTETGVEEETWSHWYDPYATGHEIRQEGYWVSETRTTTYLYERYEQARQGYDAEIGIKLPIKPVEVRIFGGWYHWDGEYEAQDDIEGFKGRLEIRVLPALYLDAQCFEDKELNGTDWMAGGRLNLPFDAVDLMHGKNPFAGAGTKPVDTPFSARLFEMVMRDLKVRMEDSGYVENEAQRQVKRSVDKKTYSETLLDDITFVDGDSGNDASDGTAESPNETLQGGVNTGAATGNENVYVYAARRDYDAVDMSAVTDIRLFGEGVGIQGNGGKSFGGRRFPTVDGRSGGPSITMGNFCTVQGMRVINSGAGGTAARVGIYAHNQEQVTIRDNLIETCSDGVRIEVDAQGLWAETMILNNRIRNNTRDGIFHDVTGDIFYLTEVRGNSCIGNGRDGMRMSLDGGVGFPVFLATVENNTFNGNTGHGLRAFMDNAAHAQLELNNTIALNNGGDGVNIRMQNCGFMSMAFIDNAMVSGNAGAGLRLNMSGAIDSVAVLGNITADNNAGAQGITANVQAGTSLVFAGLELGSAADFYNDLTLGTFANIGQALRHVGTLDAAPLRACGNGLEGIDIQVTGASFFDPNMLLLANAVANNNNSSAGGAGNIDARVTATAGGGWLGLYNVTARNSKGFNDHGIRADVSGDTSAELGVTHCEATGNRQDGLYLWANAGAAGAVTVFGENNVLANNAREGLRLRNSGGGAVSYTYDFGGGATLNSLGLNSIYGNTAYGIRNLDGNAMMNAENNFWDGAAPVFGTDYNANVTPPITWLTTDPH